MIQFAHVHESGDAHDSKPTNLEMPVKFLTEYKYSYGKEFFFNVYYLCYARSMSKYLQKLVACTSRICQWQIHVQTDAFVLVMS